MDITPTQREFMRGEFIDRYGAKCSIQESSLAPEACIWLGTEKDRMHLTQEHAKELIPLLRHFMKTGRLP